MQKRLVIFVLLFAALSLNADAFSKRASGEPELVQSGPQREHCCNCGMSLPMFYKTSHAVILTDGTKKQYCSIACFATDYPAIKNRIKTILVVDAQSEKLVPADTAFYVVGSQVKGTMSHVSKIAFANVKDAEIFRKSYGGEIMDFVHVLKMTRKE